MRWPAYDGDPSWLADAPRHEPLTLVPGDVPAPGWWPGRCHRTDCTAPLATQGPYLMPWCEAGHPIDVRPVCPACGRGRLATATRRLNQADADSYDCGHVIRHDFLVPADRAPTAHDQVLAIIATARNA